MRLAQLLLSAMIALLAVACGQGHDADSRAKDLIVLHRGNGAEPDTLDPQKSSRKWEANIIGEMFLGLTTEDAAGKTILGAAQSYSVSLDGLVWTFKLRPDMNWSDGQPVTAGDFVFAIQRLLDPATGARYASLFFVIKNAQEVNEGKLPPSDVGTRAVNDKTLEITLRARAPYFLELARTANMAPVPKHIVDKAGAAWTAPQNIVVNGPYKLAEWVANTRIRLIKNPSFQDAANVQIDEVDFYPLNDPVDELKHYQAGELDITASIPERQLKWAKETLGGEVHMHAKASSAYIQINTARAPFTDVRVRRALSLAVDREELAGRISLPVSGRPIR